MKELLFEIGIFLFLADLGWLLYYYFYATAEVYNLKEGRTYEYLGSLWFRRREGEYVLMLPRKMLERSVTTKYKIVPGMLFVQFREGEKLRVNFGANDTDFARVSPIIYVKNHIATSGKL